MPARWNSYSIRNNFIAITILSMKLTENFPISQSNLNSVIENLDGFVWSIDKDYRYITFNSNLKNAIKESYNVDINYGDKIYSILENNDPAKAKEWENAYNNGFRGERLRFIHEGKLNENVFYIDVSINPIIEKDEIYGLSCFARDVTQQMENQKARKAAEEKIRESELRFRSLIENSQNGIALLNIEGNISYCSSAVKTILGLDPEYFIGKHPSLFVHPKDWEAVESLIKENCSAHRKKVTVTYRVKDNEGKWRWIKCNVTNMINTPFVEAIVFNYIDITEKVDKERIIKVSERMYRSVYDSLLEEKVNTQIEITKTTITTQEKERTELGKELHENVNQMLASVKLYLETALIGADSNFELVDKGRDLVMKSIEELRRITKSLVPPSFRELTLEEALEELISSVRLAKKA